MKKKIIIIGIIFLNILFLKNSFACIENTGINDIFSDSNIVIIGKIINKNTIKKIDINSKGEKYTYNDTSLNIKVIKNLKGILYKNNITLLQNYFLTTCIGDKYTEIEKTKKGEKYIFFINKKLLKKEKFFHCAIKYSKYLETKDKDDLENIIYKRNIVIIIIGFLLTLIILYIFIKKITRKKIEEKKLKNFNT